MSSNAQIQANQQNGKLGGVKTDQGKAVTKFNALSHGILRQTVTEYEKDFYLEIYADLVRQYQPVTLFEKILIERITVHYLKLFRIQKAETEYMKATLDPHLSQSRGFPNLNELMTEEVINDGYRPQVTDGNIQKLADVYSRYEITIENRLYKAFHELERAIAIRTGQRVPQPTVNVFQMGSFGRNF